MGGRRQDHPRGHAGDAINLQESCIRGGEATLERLLSERDDSPSTLNLRPGPEQPGMFKPTTVYPADGPENRRHRRGGDQL